MNRMQWIVVTSLCMGLLIDLVNDGKPRRPTSFKVTFVSTAIAVGIWYWAGLWSQP